MYFFDRQGGPLPGQGASFSALLRQGCFLGHAMNQPVSQSASVTHHLGAIIGLFTLVATTSPLSVFCFGVVVTGGPVRVRLGVEQVTSRPH